MTERVHPYAVYRIWIAGGHTVQAVTWDWASVPLIFGWARALWCAVPGRPEDGCSWWDARLRAYVVLWPAGDDRAPAAGTHRTPVKDPRTVSGLMSDPAYAGWRIGYIQAARAVA